MLKATGGSLYDRSLVHPDYKDYGPRFGLAYSFDPKTVIRADTGSATRFLTAWEARWRGSTPRRPFSASSTSLCPGRAAARRFPYHENSFTTGIANPASFNPVNSNVVYIPPNSKWPYIQNWFLSRQRQLAKDTCVELAYNGNHSLRLPILADYNQATPNLPGGTWTFKPRAPIPTFGPLHGSIRPAITTTMGFRSAWSTASRAGLYFLNSFTWGNAMGDSEQALEYYSGYVAGQSAEHPRSGCGERAVQLRREAQ